MVSTQQLQTWKWPIAAVIFGFLTLSVSNNAYSQDNAEQTNVWIYQMRANLGLATTSAAKDFKSDRLGAALFAGKMLADLELPIPFVKSKDVSVGASYHTFSGVESANDSSWALQSVGAQMRVILEPGLPNNIDFAVQGGVALQRLVSEEMQSRQETVRNGFALTAGGYARWPMLKELHLIGGTDLGLGQASFFALSLGVEAGF